MARLRRSGRKTTRWLTLAEERAEIRHNDGGAPFDAQHPFAITVYSKTHRYAYRMTMAEAVEFADLVRRHNQTLEQAVRDHDGQARS